MQFQGLDLQKLRNSEVVQFNTDIIDLVTINDPAALLVVPQLAAFVGISGEISALYMTDQGSDLTPILQASDRRRDNAITGLGKNVESYTFHYDPAKRAAGVSLLDNIKMYGGGIAQQSLISETANLKNILNDWSTLPELMAAVTLLQLGDWKAELQTSNDLLHAQYLARTQEIGAMNPNTIAEKRLDAAQKYYTLRDTIGAYFTINGGINPWAKAVNDINATITQYNALIASHAGQGGDNPPPPPPPQQ